MIILPIKKKCFDLIKSGEKTEEYREIKPYYGIRFRHHIHGGRFLVTFRNGYSKQSPSIECECKLRQGIGHKEWGAPDKECYILEIIKVFGVKE